MRPYSTHWTREPNCSTSVGISGWLCAATSDSLCFLFIYQLRPLGEPSVFGRQQPRHFTPSGGQKLLLEKASAGSASPHSKMRAAVLLKGETDYVFQRPTQASHHQHHNEGWRRPEFEHWPQLTFAKFVFCRCQVFFRIYRPWMAVE